MPFEWLNNNYLWRVERTCKQCGKKYDERSNTGAWLCHYHPGKFIRDECQAQNPANYAIGKYTCCGGGSSRFYRGCTACDHDDREYPKDKKSFWDKGIKPLELPDATQTRLWTKQDDFHPVFFRPGFRKGGAGDNYKLMPYDENAASQRKEYGFLKAIKFGLKIGDELKVLTLVFADDKGKPLFDMSTSALYGQATLDLRWFLPGAPKWDLMIIFDKDEKETYTFVDIQSGKAIKGAALPVVLQHVLRHRERSPDPRIAYYTQEKKS